jgi:hypothetical protein
VADNLEIINRVIAEHRRIRENIGLTGQAVNDLEALFSLRKSFSGWAQSSIESLTEKRNHLQEVIDSLERALDKHFGYEELTLPPLFGKYLMNALIIDHKQIKEQMESIRKTLSDTAVDEPGRKELLLKKSDMEQSIIDVCQAIEEHAGHEEVILNMLRRSLEAEKGNDTGKL